MTTLLNYQQFEGRHWETGTVRNGLAHLGVVAPHARQPLSEAMLLGISGGITFGYFLFDYKGFGRILSLLSRNTFDPLETLLTRLSVPREILSSTDAAKAEARLLDVLERGQPAIVWADMFSLPYNGTTAGDTWWAMFPVVVYGHEQGIVHIADRSRQPFTVDAATFSAARARIKKDKFKLMTLSAPDMTKQKDAVQKGIWQCVELYTDKPPKGAKTNFGFAAYRHWAAMLTNTRNTQSWARFFPPGPELWAALLGHGMSPGLLGWIHAWGFGDGMERGAYATFLDEAADLLQRPHLKTAAQHFRHSQTVWRQLAQVALPDDVPLCREARELTLRRHTLFIEQGATSLDERLRIQARLREIKVEADKAFPTSESQVAATLTQMSTLVLQIHDIEYEAVKAMQAAMN